MTDNANDVPRRKPSNETVDDLLLNLPESEPRKRSEKRRRATEEQPVTPLVPPATRLTLDSPKPTTEFPSLPKRISTAISRIPGLARNPDTATTRILVLGALLTVGWLIARSAKSLDTKPTTPPVVTAAPMASVATPGPDVDVREAAPQLAISASGPAPIAPALASSSATPRAHSGRKPDTGGKKAATDELDLDTTPLVPADSHGTDKGAKPNLLTGH